MATTFESLGPATQKFINDLIDKQYPTIPVWVNKELFVKDMQKIFCNLKDDIIPECGLLMLFSDFLAPVAAVRLRAEIENMDIPPYGGEVELPDEVLKELGLSTETLIKQYRRMKEKK